MAPRYYKEFREQVRSFVRSGHSPGHAPVQAPAVRASTSGMEWRFPPVMGAQTHYCAAACGRRGAGSESGRAEWLFADRLLQLGQEAPGPRIASPS